MSVPNIPETTRTDMSFPVAGDFNLDLVRYYNSFNEKRAGFGYGWSAVNMIILMMFIVLGLDKKRRGWVAYEKYQM